jgi:hypothetical protein
MIRSQRILIVLIVMAMLVPCLIVLPKNVKGEYWGPTYTNSPTLTSKPNVSWSYTPTWNESVNFTLVTKPGWASLAGSTISGIPNVLGVFSFRTNATSTNGAGYKNLYWNVTVTGWAPTFVGTLLTSCAPGGLYSDPIYLNESATVTLIVCPSWMSMTNNGTSSSGWTIQGVPTNYGAYQISVKAVSANGLKTSYSNATVWVVMPNANVSANGYILAALVAGFAIFFTTLGYRDGRMWFVAAFLWIVGGLVAFFPISPILTVISLIPGVYYFFMGTFESW